MRKLTNALRQVMIKKVYQELNGIETDFVSQVNENNFNHIEKCYELQNDELLDFYYEEGILN